MHAKITHMHTNTAHTHWQASKCVFVVFMQSGIIYKHFAPGLEVGLMEDIYICPLRDRHSGGMPKVIDPIATISCAEILQRSVSMVVGGVTNPYMCLKAYDQLLNM